jgi:CheY-like chemotaxis protein
VADDSPYNLFVIEELIKNINPDLEIKSVYNGEEVIEQVKANLEDKKCMFKVIFVDIHMPILDGFQVMINFTLIEYRL